MEVSVVLDIDFAALKDASFKEDSVREEIVAPILKHLGFRADRDPRVVRSKSLVHPHVMLGSSKKAVTIVPDYTLYRNGVPRLVIDAKGPRENVVRGDNVSQVYSYAIHPEIRACVYGLCNGYYLTLFHIFAPDPVRTYDLQKMTELDWQDMKQKVSEIEIQRIEAFDFLLDFGVCFEMLGLDLGTSQMFMSMPIYTIGKIADGAFTLNTKGKFLQDRELMLTADISEVQLRDLESEMPAECREACRQGLSRQPFHVDIAKYGYAATFYGKLAKTVVVSTKSNERFRPLVVEGVIVCPGGSVVRPPAS